jgi:radical SAM protein with 4Fe4S-binding SPASM domain
MIPWTNIDIAPRGNIAPCCKYKYDVSNNEFMNITTNTIQEYINSESLKTIKNQMLNHIWPEGCIRCKSEEQNNIKSKRILDYERWKNHFDNYTEEQGFITASIAFGNTCNLKCIMCSPESSSRWRKEWIEVYGIDMSPLEVINNTTSENIYSALPNAIHFDIPGGEPFLSEVDKQRELLQRYVDTGQSSNMTLHYTTNAQRYPDSSWFDLWDNFAEIDMQLSVDGVGDRYEYIRYPANADVLAANVVKYNAHAKNADNFRLSVSHTLSAYNIYYLNEFFTWCNDSELPRPWIGKVHTPKHMRPDIFPDNVKKQIVSHMRTSTHEDVHTWAHYLENNSSNEYYDDWIKYKDKHDLYRGTNFAKTFPELEELINEL